MARCGGTKPLSRTCPTKGATAGGPSTALDAITRERVDKSASSAPCAEAPNASVAIASHLILPMTVVDESSDNFKALTVRFDADHCGAHAVLQGQVLPRLLRKRHEDSAFLEHSERSFLRISTNQVKHNVHVANMAEKALADGGIADTTLRLRFERNLQSFLSLAEAAKHYPCIKRAWVEFLGEPPTSGADRVDPVQTST